MVFKMDKKLNKLLKNYTFSYRKIITYIDNFRYLEGNYHTNEKKNKKLLLIIKYLTKNLSVIDDQKNYISSIVIFIDDNVKEKRIFRNVGDEAYFLISNSSVIHIQYHK